MEVLQPSFTSGELSPSLFARIDLERYYTGLRTCRNFIVLPHGGVVNRPGWRFCDSTKNHLKKSRLVDFIFSSTQAYILEFGEGYIRFHARGAMLVYPEGDPNAGQPVEVATPYAESDLPELTFTQSADVMTICHTGHYPRQLKRFSNYSWTLEVLANVNGPFQEINSDTSLTIYASAATGIVNIVASGDLFLESHEGRLLYLEDMPDDTAKRWEVQKAIVAGDIRRAAGQYYEAVNSGTTGSVMPTVLEGTENDGDPGVIWRYVHSGFGILRITAVADARHATATVLSHLPYLLVRNATKVVTNVTDASGKIQVDTTPVAHGWHTGDVVTFAGINGVPNANGTFGVKRIDADTVELLNSDFAGAYIDGGTGDRGYSATYKWAFEAWGSDQGYPAASMYYQQRQIFGGAPTAPQRVWMSRTKGFLDFGKNIPLLDDDGITFSLNARRLNEIRHFVALRELVAITTEGPWLIKKEQGSPIPTADFQGKGGTTHLPPVVVNQRALYVLAKGRAIRSLGYTFESDSYEGRDVTVTAAHLLKRGLSIVDWTYQETPFSCVWMVRSDGVLLGLTYLPDQNIIGWHRHDTDGFVESVCSIPEGDEDSVYLVVRREINGETKRYVERFASRFVENPWEAFHVDSGLTYDGRGAGDGVTFTLTNGIDDLPEDDLWTYQETLLLSTGTEYFSGESDVGDAIVVVGTDGLTLILRITEFVDESNVKVQPNRTVPEAMRETEITGFDMARDTFTGLDHLEGKDVAILADGVVTERTVAGGEFVLDAPAVLVHAGLRVISDIETLSLNTQNGATLHGRVKNIGSVVLLVQETKGVLVGQDADHLYLTPAVPSGTYTDADEEVDGTLEVNIASNWSTAGRVLVRQEDPLPATILGIIPKVEIGGD